MSGRVDVDPAGLAVTVSFTNLAGAAVTAYSDAALTTPLTAPIAISNLTTFYVHDDGPYLASVKMGTVELGPVVASQTGLPAFVNVANLLTPPKVNAVISAATAGASGSIVAGPVQLTSLFDVQAVGSTDTDLPGQSIDVPASARPQLLRAKYEIRSVSGSAAIAANMTIAAYISNAANQILAIDEETFVQVTAVSVSFRGKLHLELYLPGPVAAATYKIRAKLLAAAPASWTSASIIPGFGAAVGGANNFYSQAV